MNGEKQKALNYLLSSTRCAIFAEAKATFLFPLFFFKALKPSLSVAEVIAARVL